MLIMIRPELTVMVYRHCAGRQFSITSQLKEKKKRKSHWFPNNLLPMGSHHSLKQNKFQDKFCNCYETVLHLVQRECKSKPQVHLTQTNSGSHSSFSGGSWFWRKNTVTRIYGTKVLGLLHADNYTCVMFPNFPLLTKGNPTRYQR